MFSTTCNPHLQKIWIRPCLRASSLARCTSHIFSPTIHCFSNCNNYVADDINRKINGWPGKRKGRGTKAKNETSSAAEPGPWVGLVHAIWERILGARDPGEDQPASALFEGESIAYQERPGCQAARLPRHSHGISMNGSGLTRALPGSSGQGRQVCLAFWGG